jgi:hypothetical protein
LPLYFVLPISLILEKIPDTEFWAWAGYKRAGDKTEMAAKMQK